MCIIVLVEVSALLLLIKRHVGQVLWVEVGNEPTLNLQCHCIKQIPMSWVVWVVKLYLQHVSTSLANTVNIHRSISKKHTGTYKSKLAKGYKNGLQLQWVIMIQAHFQCGIECEAIWSSTYHRNPTHQVLRSTSMSQTARYPMRMVAKDQTRFEQFLWVELNTGLRGRWDRFWNPPMRAACD